MKRKHTVNIHVSHPNGSSQLVLKSGVRHFPKKLMTFLFGECTEVLVLKPGQSVQSVEIHEIQKGGDPDEQNQAVT